MPSKGPEYEPTQKLVNIALKSGMTQGIIAKLCRVDQSTVSRWKKGERRARLQQIKPLLQKFADRMERPPFQLYQRIEGREPKFYTSQFLKVDGRLILREAFVSCERPYNECEAIRLSVQEVSRGRFALIAEYAQGPLPKKSGKSEIIDLRSRDMPWMLPKEGNAWFLDQEGLIAQMCNIAKINKQKIRGLDRIEFMLVLALLRHGYTVEGLETLAPDAPDPEAA